MRLSQFHLHTEKETPAEAEIVSHKLMLKAGMIRKLAAGLYTWSPLGLRVLRKVETIVREEMNRAGAIELLMPTVQPAELWQETGRWQKFGPQLLKISDRKDAEYCYAPTAEEVITDFARQELSSYKQLPVNFYQIQTKFRDEIRPRFGVMRSREFLMKDAYSFHLDDASLQAEYRNMYEAYSRIFSRLGLKFRAVFADTGAIGGSASHEFHVLAESGEDAIAFSDGSDYAANVELAEAFLPATEPAAPTQAMEKVETPGKTSIEQVAAHLGAPESKILKTLAVIGEDERFYLLLLRGDHEANPVKLAKVLGMGAYRPASDEEIEAKLGCRPGYIGPVGKEKDNLEPFMGEGRHGFPEDTVVVADREVIALSDFVCGANTPGFHYVGMNWGRDLARPHQVFDLRNVVEGDLSPDGRGRLGIGRGIEVGHVFALGDRYSEAMGCSVLDAGGKPVHPMMGCYGIGVSRIVAAAIEQNHDAAGIRWPAAMAPWQVAVCMINPKNDPAVREAAEALLAELNAAGIDSVLDDRGLRPGAMFADIELIGIPHRVVVSERGLAAGDFEYRHRDAEAAENIDRATLESRLRA